MNTDTDKETRIKQLESERRITISRMDDAVDSGKLHLRKMLLVGLSEIDNELKQLKQAPIIEPIKIKSVDTYADVVKQRAQKEAETESAYPDKPEVKIIDVPETKGTSMDTRVLVIVGIVIVVVLAYIFML